MQLPIRVTLKYGSSSSSEFNREVLEPTADDLLALLQEMSKYVTIIDVNRLDGGEESIQAVPPKDSSVPKLQWELNRFDGIDASYEIACNDPALAVNFLVEWATTDNHRSPLLGGYEWSKVTWPGMEDAVEDALYFSFDDEPLLPVDAKRVPKPKFIDPSELLSPLTQTLAEAWNGLRAAGGLNDMYAFGLDRLGEGFLVVVGYRNTGGEAIEIDELFIDVEEVNAIVSEANEKVEEWEETYEADSTDGYRQIVDATYEVGVAALCDLRSSGTLSDAPHVILNVWHREAEPTDVETVGRCNPPEIAALADPATGAFSH